MQSTNCPTCGKVLAPGAAFCRRCGASFSAPHRPEIARTSNLVATRLWASWALAVAAALAIGIGLTCAALDRAIHPPRLAQAIPMPGPSPFPIPPPQAPRIRFPALPALSAWRRHLPPDLLAAGKERSGPGDLRGQILQQGPFAARPLAGFIFAGADLLQADFTRADLRDADLRGADLSQADFGGADLAGARFDGANLHQATFAGVDAAAVDGQTEVRDGIVQPVRPPPLRARGLGRATFVGARFSQVSLDGFDLAGADFTGASLSQVGMRGADLAGANLRQSRQESSDFAGARLDGADLRGADLSTARNLTKAQIESAITDATTRLPD